MRYVTFILFFVSLFSCQRAAYIQQQGKVVDQSFVGDMPFQFHHDLIFIDVEINGEKHLFLFDTGAELCVVDKSLASTWHDVKIKSGKVTDSSGKSKQSDLITMPRMTIADVSFDGFKGFAMDLTSLQRFLGCVEIKGIIGNNVMRKATWQIDYEKQQMRFSDLPNQFTFSDQVKIHTMKAHKYGNVDIPITINGKEYDCTFDSGYTGFCRIDDTTALAGQDYVTIAGVTGGSLHQVRKGYYRKFLANNVVLPDDQYQQKEIVVQPNASGLLGNDYFQHFTMTIDWAADKLYLDPQTPIESDALNDFALRLGPNYLTNQAEVMQYIEGPGDQFIEYVGLPVLQINGKPIPKNDREALCAFWEYELEVLKDKDQFTIIVQQENEKKLLTINRIK